MPGMNIDHIVSTSIFLHAESRRLTRARCEHHGITATQLDLLKLLQQLGPLSFSQLAHRLDLKNSTVTGLVNALVDLEFVHRRQSGMDRRVWLVELTGSGRELTARVDVAAWDLLRGALDSLPPDELQTAVDVLTRLAVRVSSAVAAVHSGGNF